MFKRFGAKPHHVQHPDHGWLTHEHLDALSELRDQVGHDQFIGGPPEIVYAHWVEHDVSTQLVGYTRLTAEELEQRAAESKQYLAARAALESEAKADRDLILARAKDDPAFAAMARLMGFLPRK